MTKNGKLYSSGVNNYNDQGYQESKYDLGLNQPLNSMKNPNAAIKTGALGPRQSPQKNELNYPGEVPMQWESIGSKASTAGSLKTVNSRNGSDSKEDFRKFAPHRHFDASFSGVAGNGVDERNSNVTACFDPRSIKDISMQGNGELLSSQSTCGTKINNPLIHVISTFYFSRRPLQ